MSDRARAARQLLKAALDLDSIKRLKPHVSAASIDTIDDTRDAVFRLNAISARMLRKARSSSRPEMWRALSDVADKKYDDTWKSGLKELVRHPVRYLGFSSGDGDNTLKLSTLKAAGWGANMIAGGEGFVHGLTGTDVAPAANTLQTPGKIVDIANTIRQKETNPLESVEERASEIAGNVAGQRARKFAPEVAERATGLVSRFLPRAAPYLAKAAPVVEGVNAVAMPVTGAMANLKFMAGIDGKVRNALTNPSQSAIDATMKTPYGQSMLGQAWKRIGEERKANPVDASGQRYGVFNPQAPAAPAGWDAPGGLPMAPSAKPPAFKPPASVTPPPAFKPPAPLNAPGVPSVTKPAGMTAAPGPGMTAAPKAPASTSPTFGMTKNQSENGSAESGFLDWLESHG